MADLYQRLKAIRAERTSPRVSGALNDRAPGADWERVAPGVWSRTVDVPVSERWAAQIDGEGRWTGVSELLRMPSGVPVRVIDIETSGMGGSGSVAFLVGIGSFTVDNAGVRYVRVEQLFASDLGSERDLIGVLVVRLSRAELALTVTFNGASFDMPVLRARCVMARTRLPEGPHLDLLPVARRLYGGALGSCRLGRLERAVLGAVRDEDVPSAEVPERYLAFVRGAEAATMGAVVAHHQHDIVNLALLALEVNRQLTEAERGGPLEPVPAAPTLLAPDGFAVLRLMAHRSDAVGRVALLDRAVRLAALEEQRAQNVRRTLRRLAVHRSAPRSAPERRPDEERRSARWASAHELVRDLARRCGDIERRLGAARLLWAHRGEEKDAHEYAIVLERGRGAYDDARLVVEAALERCGESDALRRRLDRLIRRQRRRSSMSDS